MVPSILIDDFLRLNHVERTSLTESSIVPNKMSLVECIFGYDDIAENPRKNSLSSESPGHQRPKHWRILVIGKVTDRTWRHFILSWHPILYSMPVRRGTMEASDLKSLCMA
jgi:hypothetical protein